MKTAAKPEVRPALPELLAPAGEPAAARAAFEHGADAVYLGLRSFSARAEATNFTEEEVAATLAEARSLTPRRRVYVTVNTLMRTDELAPLADAFDALTEIGVDAVIVQDLGALRLARERFPRLRLHASTQLAIHSVAGARAAAALGCRRVTLARELTLEEIAAIAAGSGIEVETFLHGALCYSYSGLCLYSSLLRDGSGNRGRCAYPCRDRFSGNGGPRFPFSMKDLALPEEIGRLAATGIASLKIEGRKKSPLYVAAVTRYYRGLLDGAFRPAERKEAEAAIRTIFSRPWTDLFVAGRENAETVDPEAVGHRGATIGRVIAVRRRPDGFRVCFRTASRLEVHDGLQVECPGRARPFGFPVHALYLAERRDPVFEAPADAEVEVTLPPEHADLPLGAEIALASSQALKRRFRVRETGACAPSRPVAAELEIASGRVRLRLRLLDGTGEATAEEAADLQPAKDAAEGEAAGRKAVARLGGSGFELAEFTLRNPAGLFAPLSLLNRLRREGVEKLGEEIGRTRAARRAEHRLTLAGIPDASEAGGWIVRTDRWEHLDAFLPEDREGIVETVFELSAASQAPWEEAARRAATFGRIRFALPPVIRAWEEERFLRLIEQCRAAGWNCWEIANPAGFDWFGPETDLTADWPLYALNPLAIEELASRGIRRVACSPEDGRANLCALLASRASRLTIVLYQDPPLFLSENCALRQVDGHCPGRSGCKAEKTLRSGAGEEIALLARDCRTIALGPALCRAQHLGELRAAGGRWWRADFQFRRYTPEEAVRIWRSVRAGRPVQGAIDGNWDRGMR